MPVVTMQDIAVSVSADDLFVLHEVTPGQLVHIDGSGRGLGWAGNIEVSAEHEPHLRDGAHSLHRLQSSVPVRVFGPYWNVAAAIVPAGDYTIVFGGPNLSVSDDDMQRAAGEAAWAAGDVPASKRLADDLEVSQAIVSVATLNRSSIRAAAEGLATSAAQALGCEFGAVLLANGELYLAHTGWQPNATDAEIVTAIRGIPLGDLELLVADDLRSSDWASHPLDVGSGLVTQAAVRIRAGDDEGVLVVAHHGDMARGFTALCRRVAVGIGAAGSDLLSDVVSR